MNLFLFLLPILLSMSPVHMFIEIFRRKQEKKMEDVPPEPTKPDESEVARQIPILEISTGKPPVIITNQITRITGNVSMPDGQHIKENMVIRGNLTLGSKCHVQGNLNVFGEAKVGEGSMVKGNVVAERSISVGRDAKVAGIVDSAAQITLEENATVEAASTEKSVVLASGARISRRVLAGEALLTKNLLSKRERKPLKEVLAGPIPSLDTPPERKEAEEIVTEKGRLLRSFQQGLDSLGKPETDASFLRGLTLREIQVYILAASGHDADEIALRLLMDPVQVQGVLDSLIEKRYLDQNLRPLKIESAVMVAEKEARQGQQLEQLRVDELFERLLASKLRPEAKDKTSKGAVERERLDGFLSQLLRRPSYGEPDLVKEMPSKEDKETFETRPGALTRFQMRVFGEIFEAGDGVTAVVGDVEIPDRSTVDKPLVVKGKVKIGADCRVLRNLKALGGISIANGCLVKASVASGDIVELGKDTTIEGDMHAESSVRLSEGSGIFGPVDAGGAYVSTDKPASEASGEREKEHGELDH